MFFSRYDDQKVSTAKRLTKNHYVAPRPTDESPTPVHLSKSYHHYSDGEDSQKEYSEHTTSEYISSVSCTDTYLFSVLTKIFIIHI